jgi:cytochrome c peroxidase
MAKSNFIIFLIIIFNCTSVFAFKEIKDIKILNDAKNTFGILPEKMESKDNPITSKKVKLGKMLFYDTRLSVDNTVSCAKCHFFGFYGIDGLPKSIGNNYKENDRNAPTVFNAAGQVSQHWIGDRASVEEQAEKSLTGQASFGNPDENSLIEKLSKIKQYKELFKNTFPNDKIPITAKNIGLAIGAFERTLITPAPFDEYLDGNIRGIERDEMAGLELFMAYGCSSCHKGVYLGGNSYEKFGVFANYWEYTGSKKIDEGRFIYTKDNSDKYVFKVPILRNITKTAPYFHDGSVENIRDAVRIMAKIQLDVDLSDEDVNGISTFLRSLTGEIPKNILSIPILPQN